MLLFFMKLTRRRLVLTVVMVILAGGMLRLSAWQFDRAEQKLALETAAQRALQSAPLPLRADAPAPYMRVAARGRYLPDYEILLDNRVHRGRVGYYVITPLALADDAPANRAVLVNRGWVAAGASRAQLPAPPAPPRDVVTVVGVTMADESDAFVLSDEAESGAVRQNLRIGRLAAESGLALLSVVIVKDAAADDIPIAAGVIKTDFKSAQSVVYGWQWLLFAALALIFYVILWRRM